MAYRIEFSPYARRQFGALSGAVQARLRSHIDALAENPRPPGIQKLKGHDKTFRCRVGSYRIVYELHDDILLVLIVEVGHRREVYRRRR